MDQPQLTDITRLQQLYSYRVGRRGHAGDTAHVTPEAILAVIRREGTEPQRLATLEHVMSCADCHRDYEWLSAVNESALEAEGATGVARLRWGSRWTQLALAASLAVAAGTALLVMRPGPDLERGDADEIELVAPRAGQAGSGALTFIWRPVPGVTRYVLEVQRADGSVAFSDTTADTTVSIADPDRVLAEGEYRWWVRETSDGSEPHSSALRRLRLSGD